MMRPEELHQIRAVPFEQGKAQRGTARVDGEYLHTCTSLRIPPPSKINPGISRAY
jgi:hypothetical protein